MFCYRIEDCAGQREFEKMKHWMEMKVKEDTIERKNRDTKREIVAVVRERIGGKKKKTGRKNMTIVEENVEIKRRVEDTEKTKETEKMNLMMIEEGIEKKKIEVKRRVEDTERIQMS